jgi:hypothetical protein
MGGWVYTRARVDHVEKRKFLTLRGLELGPFSRPARSQSLYRLRYRGSRNEEFQGKCDRKQIILVSVNCFGILPEQYELRY